VCICSKTYEAGREYSKNGGHIYCGAGHICRVRDLDPESICRERLNKLCNIL
jgi:hypothetical protein